MMMFQDSELLPLKTLRLHMVYPTFIYKNLFVLKTLLTISGNYTNLYEIHRTKSTRYGTNSFRYQAAKLWNSLPEEARKITSFNHFKQFIKTWNGASCKCSLCK